MKTKLFLLTSFLLLTSNAICFGQSIKHSLKSGEDFKVGQIIYSADKHYKLLLQNDALVVKKGNVIVWQSDMQGSWLPTTKIDRITFNNGEINCLFHNSIQWSSRTNFPNSKLVLGNDGIIKIAASDNSILWESFAVTANSIKPPLVSGGDEGPFNDSVMQPADKIKLYVVFVDWTDAKATENNFDSLWNLVTGNGELLKSFKKQGRAINLSVEPYLAKKWIALPKPAEFYFPPHTPANEWNWETYIKDCPALLHTAFGLDTFTNNSIAVFLPNPSVGEKWKNDVPTGNHIINFRGMKVVITGSPDIYTRKYGTLMHEIGHGFGTGELYPFPPFEWYDTEMMGLDVMSNSDLATGFMGYHRYRYGWMPYKKEKPTSVYLTEPHSYRIVLTPLSSDNGIKMVLIPDKSVSQTNLHKPSKLWGIEIAQDVQSKEQFLAGKNEKMITEGEMIIIYTVEYPEQEGKRAIRLFPKKAFDKDKDKWRKVFLYEDGDTFENPSAPFDLKIYKNKDGGFYLDIKLKTK